MSVTLLNIELLLRRRSVPLWIACALVVTAVLVQRLATLPMQARIAERQDAHARSSRAAIESERSARPVKPAHEDRLAAFTATLGAKRELAGYVAAVFEQAEKRGLVLAQAEYKLEHDKQGRFLVYQMTLPLRGPYPKLRGFVDATLARIPCAALDDVDLKREAIGANETEARLRFVFFLRAEPS